jgi:hypothetical protein
MGKANRISKEKKEKLEWIFTVLLAFIHWSSTEMKIDGQIIATRENCNSSWKRDYTGISGRFYQRLKHLARKTLRASLISMKRELYEYGTFQGRKLTGSSEIDYSDLRFWLSPMYYDMVCEDESKNIICPISGFSVKFGVPATFDEHYYIDLEECMNPYCWFSSEVNGYLKISLLCDATIYYPIQPSGKIFIEFQRPRQEHLDVQACFDFGHLENKYILQILKDSFLQEEEALIKRDDAQPVLFSKFVSTMTRIEHSNNLVRVWFKPSSTYLISVYEVTLSLVNIFEKHYIYYPPQPQFDSEYSECSENEW